MIELLGITDVSSKNLNLQYSVTLIAYIVMTGVGVFVLRDI